MRADDRGHLAVEMPAHRDLLGRGFGVEVDEDDAGALLHLLDFLQHAGKRIVDAQHEHPAHRVDDADADARLRAGDVAAVAGDAGREVERAQQPRLDADVVDRFFLIPDVIPGGHDVDAGVEDLFAEFARDAKAGGRVLRVGDDKIELVVVPECGHTATHKVASWASDDIADEEQSGHDAGDSPEIAMRIGRPRRSVIRGMVMRSSPWRRLAVARLVSHAAATRTARANRP